MLKDIDELKNLIQNRKIVIWAANLEGVGYSRMLRRNGFSVEFFIDDRAFRENKKSDINVVPFEDIPTLSKSDYFVIIATKHREYRVIASEKLQACGFVESLDYVHGRTLCNYYPTIEPIGTCNLKCITCNMALDGANKGKGLMSPIDYEDILTKLTREIPFVSGVSLFLWGEATMHPGIGDFIRITKDFGLTCEISTNLNFGKHLGKLLEAGPDILAIACSGREERYETTHTGGRWSDFKRNLDYVAHYTNSVKNDISVRFFFHMYKHNLNVDYDYFETYCRDNNFYFFPIMANLFPEQVYNHVVEGIPLPEPMERAKELLLFDYDDHLAYAKSSRDKYCPFMQVFPTVRWDRSVVHCSNMENPTISKDFMSESLATITMAREAEKKETCKKCMEHGLHRFFDVVNVAVDRQPDGRRVVKRL